ncbi:MAG: F0F1 ATP synthase subunit epsilon [Pseudomonadota bacterium]
MADTFAFDLVSPEARLVSGQAVAVQISGAEGDLTAMPGHAPMITTLRPGFVRVEMDGGTQEFAVFGGFAEIGAEATSVLAERAYARADLTKDIVSAIIEDAEKAAASAGDDASDVANKLVADLNALMTDAGL